MESVIVRLYLALFRIYAEVGALTQPPAARTLMHQVALDVATLHRAPLNAPEPAVLRGKDFKE